MRIAAAMALLGLAGCVDNASSPKAAPQSVIEVKIEPQGSVKADQAQRLSVLIAEEAQRRNTVARDEKLDGVVNASRAGDGLYLVTVIDVNNGKGKRLHRIVNESVQPKQQTLTDAAIANLAVSTVRKLTLWHMASGFAADEATGSIRSSGSEDVAALGPDDRIATVSIAAIMAVKPTFDIAIGPAPGDGAEALKAALQSELAKAAPSGDPSRYHVRGEVTVSSTETGDVGVAIRWQVAAPDGRPIGTVTQKRATAPSRIASYWGNLAKAAAEPAADGILEMLKPAPMLPGNAS